MVTIQRYNHILTVTNGAYQGIYKPLGYTIVGEPGDDNSVSQAYPCGTTTPGDVTDHHEAPGATEADPDGPNSYNEAYLTGEAPDEDTEEEDPVDEKPLGEMSFKELKQYAETLGLNANGYSSKRDLKEAIKAHLD